RDEPLDVLTADEWDVVAEALPVQVEEAVAVAVLLGPQLAELLRRGREVLLEAVGEVVEDAGVLFLEGDGQGQDLLLAEALERAHGGSSRGAGGRPIGRRRRGIVRTRGRASA